MPGLGKPEVIAFLAVRELPPGTLRCGAVPEGKTRSLRLLLLARRFRNRFPTAMRYFYVFYGNFTANWLEFGVIDEFPTPLTALTAPGSSSAAHL